MSDAGDGLAEVKRRFEEISRDLVSLSLFILM
jgi:hypothetical protein